MGEITKIKKYGEEVTEEMLQLLQELADKANQASDEIFDDDLDHGTNNILIRCDELVSDIKKYLHLRKIAFVKAEAVNLNEKVFTECSAKYRVFKNSKNDYLLCQPSEQEEGVDYTIVDDDLNEIDGGIMEMNPEDDEILVKDLFQFSEFKENDEYSEISGTEDEVEEIYDLINEYMDQL
ncbi:Uncharacterised protein [Anaerostipes hadrus]|uniref:Uncharacterized protein n=1 Tax=Anaerostipes hadrus TaxID=649756 RepID=A0A174NVM5_ANAHA|nr:hypothetical protein [Anaerostipes hadrus]CUP50887.1 Uncharacterised protein [Anaerostipes hadrus]